MATSIPVEEDAGTFTGEFHLHDGYYAGDFDRGEFPHSARRWWTREASS